MPTVLVVDDSESVRALLRGALESQDFNVVEAREGFEAFEAARSLEPDIILLDLLLPGLDGNQVLELLMEDDATRHIPVVALTYAGPGNEPPGETVAGFHARVPKPSRPEDLPGFVRDVLLAGGG